MTPSALAEMSRDIVISSEAIDRISAIIEPDNKPISFSVKNATLMEALVHLVKAAGISVMIERIGFAHPKRLSVTMREVPLDHVLDIIADAFGLRWYRDGAVYVLA